MPLAAEEMVRACRAACLGLKGLKLKDPADTRKADSIMEEAARALEKMAADSKEGFRWKPEEIEAAAGALLEMRGQVEALGEASRARKALAETLARLVKDEPAFDVYSDKGGTRKVSKPASPRIDRSF